LTILDHASIDQLGPTS